MKFSKEQKEGVAKVMDNLATACLLAAIVPGLVDHRVSWQVGLLLVGMFTVLLFIGIALRGGNDDAT